jgi:hypothetical protein
MVRKRTFYCLLLFITLTIYSYKTIEKKATIARGTINRNSAVCLNLNRFFNDVTGAPYCVDNLIWIVSVYFVA